MGKGDRRTRRGKIYAGSFGKSRPKSPDAKAKPAGGAAEKAAAPAAKPAAAKAPARKKSG